MSTDIKALSENLKSLSVEQIADLLKQLSTELDVDLEKLLSASNSESTDNTQLSEQSTKKKYVVTLVDFDKAKQINIIRAIKNAKPELSLIEAKNQLSSLPFIIQGDLNENAADELKKQWEEYGAKIEKSEDK